MEKTLADHNFVVVGLSHHNTPLPLLEQATFDQNRLPLALRDLHTRKQVKSGLIISTCNRVEVYALGKGEALPKSCEEFLLHWCRGPAEEVRRHLYKKEGKAALQQLFDVAASLDSMVPGEPQVFGQVKAAYAQQMRLHYNHPLMDRIMRKTFSVAKRVRTETGIATQPVSLAYVAVELARKIFGELRGSKVMLVGAGKMGELALRHLMARGISELIICNRSYQNALTLATEFSATAIHMEALTEYLKQVDIVIASTAAQGFLINKKSVSMMMPERMNRPIFFIDIAMPRNIDPMVNRIDNVYLYNLDDLKTVSIRNVEQRKQEMVKGTQIVAGEVESFLSTLAQQRFRDTIGQLQQSVKKIVEIEMGVVADRLKQSLSPEEIDVLKRSSERLTAKLMQQPAHFLKNAAVAREVEVLRQAFGLANGLDSEEDPHRQSRQ